MPCKKGEGFTGPPGSKRPINAKMLRAAKLSAMGYSRDLIAKEMGIDGSTVSRWLQREDMRAIRAAELNEVVAAMAPKAYAVLNKQLDDPNPWVAQGAARELIRLYGIQQGQSDSNVVVSFAAMPKPGAPGSAGAIEGNNDGTIVTEFSE